MHGEPLISRLSRDRRGVLDPGTWRVRIGTPVDWLVAQAGGYADDAARLVVGGPMMGRAQANDAVPVTKASHCVLVLTAGELRDPAPELPCIRCGDCAAACPASLLPQQLHWHLRAGDWDAVAAHALCDCIECGLLRARLPQPHPAGRLVPLGQGRVALARRPARARRVSTGTV